MSLFVIDLVLHDSTDRATM